MSASSAQAECTPQRPRSRRGRHCSSSRRCRSRPPSAAAWPSRQISRSLASVLGESRRGAASLGRLGLEQRAHVEQLVYFLFGGHMHEGALAGPQVDPPLGLHAVQRLADRLPADPRAAGPGRSPPCADPAGVRRRRSGRSGRHTPTGATAPVVAKVESTGAVRPAIAHPPAGRAGFPASAGPTLPPTEIGIYSL